MGSTSRNLGESEKYYDNFLEQGIGDRLSMSMSAPLAPNIKNEGKRMGLKGARSKGSPKSSKGGYECRDLPPYLPNKKSQAGDASSKRASKIHKPITAKGSDGRKYKGKGASSSEQYASNAEGSKKNGYSRKDESPTRSLTGRSDSFSRNTSSGSPVDTTRKLSSVRGVERRISEREQ